jgi:hypothetical protein
MEKLAMVEHSINLGHCIQFHDTSILAKKCGHTQCVIRVVTEIELHPNSVNREKDFSLSKSWKPLIQTLKEHDKALSKEM